MPICVQYIFNMSLGTTVAMSVATAAFLDYVWAPPAHTSPMLVYETKI